MVESDLEPGQHGVDAGSCSRPDPRQAAVDLDSSRDQRSAPARGALRSGWTLWVSTAARSRRPRCGRRRATPARVPARRASPRARTRPRPRRGPIRCWSVPGPRPASCRPAPSASPLLAAASPSTIRASTLRSGAEPRNRVGTLAARSSAAGMSPDRSSARAVYTSFQPMSIGCALVQSSCFPAASRFARASSIRGGSRRNCNHPSAERSGATPPSSSADSMVGAGPWPRAAPRPRRCRPA